MCHIYFPIDKQREDGLTKKVITLQRSNEQLTKTNHGLHENLKQINLLLQKEKKRSDLYEDNYLGYVLYVLRQL